MAFVVTGRIESARSSFDSTAAACDRAPAVLYAHLDLKPLMSVKSRLRDFFVSSAGRIVTREEIIAAAADPITGAEPENWHQRLSELRVEEGYQILSWRDREDLSPGQYLLEEPRPTLKVTRKRRIPVTIRQAVLARDGRCTYPGCGLADGDVDPIGGGTVRLTVDHKDPFAWGQTGDTEPTIDDFQALCARHQVIKKNFFDPHTGKFELTGILQAAPEAAKREAFEFLKKYFAE